MKLSIEKFLRENTNYLVAVYLLAQEKDEFELLEKALGSEDGQIQMLDRLRTYTEHLKVHNIEDFPIVIQNGKIVKNDFHIAAAVLAGKKQIAAVEKKIPVEIPEYGDEWLKKFTPTEQKKIKARYAQLVDTDNKENEVLPKRDQKDSARTSPKEDEEKSVSQSPADSSQEVSTKDKKSLPSEGVYPSHPTQSH